MLGVFGVLVDGGAFPFFNGEAGLDAQNFGGLDARLGKPTKLRIGGGKPKRNDSDIGRARRTFAERRQRLGGSSADGVGMADDGVMTDVMLKRIKAAIRL